MIFEPTIFCKNRFYTLLLIHYKKMFLYCHFSRPWYGFSNCILNWHIFKAKKNIFVTGHLPSHHSFPILPNPVLPQKSHCVTFCTVSIYPGFQQAFATTPHFSPPLLHFATTPQFSLPLFYTHTNSHTIHLLLVHTS